MAAIDTAWVHEAVGRIEADFNRSSDTHLIRLEFPGAPDLRLYLKDESTHPSGSLKHRLARSLFLYGLCNGWIHHDTPVIESSSGNTAISEAYFARLLGLPFIAVIPEGTSSEKIRQIEHYGASCHPVADANAIYRESARLAESLGGHYMDQFTFAERATDWRGNNNIAESIFDQMRLEPDPEPSWIVMSAGTGGTSATIGRFLRYQRLHTRLCVADPENSVFYDWFTAGKLPGRPPPCSRIEGIGRPRVEPSFLPSVVDRMEQVPDAASIATMEFLDSLLHRRCGGSTGTNVWAALKLVSEMKQRGQRGSVITLICDGGERYAETLYSEAWQQDQGLDVQPWLERLNRFYDTGVLQGLPDHDWQPG